MPKFPNLELKEFQLESKDYDLDKWLQSCKEETHWVEGHIKLFGKIHKIPRLQSCMQIKEFNIPTLAKA